VIARREPRRLVLDRTTAPENAPAASTPEAAATRRRLGATVQARDAAALGAVAALTNQAWRDVERAPQFWHSINTYDDSSYGSVRSALCAELRAELDAERRALLVALGHAARRSPRHARAVGSDSMDRSQMSVPADGVRREAPCSFPRGQHHPRSRRPPRPCRMIERREELRDLSSPARSSTARAPADGGQRQLVRGSRCAIGEPEPLRPARARPRRRPHPRRTCAGACRRCRGARRSRDGASLRELHSTPQRRGADLAPAGAPRASGRSAHDDVAGIFALRHATDDEVRRELGRDVLHGMDREVGRARRAGPPRSP